MGGGVLDFLLDTRVRCTVTIGPLREEGEDRERARKAGRGRPRLHFRFLPCSPSVSFASSLLSLCLVLFFWAAREAGEGGALL